MVRRATDRLPGSLSPIPAPTSARGRRRGPALAGLAGLALLVAVAFRLEAGVAWEANGVGGTENPSGSDRPIAAPPEQPFDPHVLVLIDGYREVFATLAQSGRAAAVERATKLESQALAESPGKAVEWLSLADRYLLDEFVLARPDCALPLAVFYQRLVLVHAAQKRYSLSQRALRVTEGLYGKMSLAARNEDDRRLTSTAYAGFAADLLTVPAPTRAAEMLSLGLLLTPDDVDASIALAILLLRDRQPAAAAVRLDRVLGAHPGHREARLRRALMRAGFSADGRVADELEALATSGENDWIALVAAQERARRLLATGDYAKASAFLNQAIERFPAESSLRVALAFAAARSGKRAAAQSAVESALAAQAPPGEAARRRFGELPIRLLRPKAVVAEAAADARVPMLAAAISATGRSAPVPSVAPGAATAPVTGQSR
jgi:hypothetical protein